MSDEDMTVCYLCNKAEEDASRVLECIQCCKSAHLSCLKLSGNAAQKAKKKNFYCSPACAEIFQRNNNKGSGDVIDEIRSLVSNMSLEIRGVKEDMVKLSSSQTLARNEMRTIAETSRSIEKSQGFLAAKFDEIKLQLEYLNGELKKLHEENVGIRKEIGGVHERQQQMEDKIEMLEAELDRVQRETLSRNAVILGLPMVENEDIRGMIVKIGAAVKCTLQNDDILEARRLKVKDGLHATGPIIVSFRSVQVKEALFDAKRAHGNLPVQNISSSFNTSANRITIRDEMTSFGRNLLEEVKQLKDQLGFKFVWPGRNGKILLRRQDGAKVEQISSKKQLYTMAKPSQKRSLDFSSSSMTSQSSPITEPIPKKR